MDGRGGASAPVDAEAIVVDDIEFAEWPDSCPAAAEEDEACAAVIAPGFVIVFEAGGEQYEYHTDLNGIQYSTEEGNGRTATGCLSEMSMETASHEGIRSDATEDC